MSIFNEFNKKEKPVFTGIARGVGGFGFGAFGSSAGQVFGSFEATGGQITAGTATANGYTYHVFDQANSPETFQVTDIGDGNGYIEVLLVAGGGGGGNRGGGGGAGGVRYLTIPITGTTTMPVSVGDGAATPGPGASVTGASGSNSVLINPLGPTTYTSTGGGGGGATGGGGLAGGSGGGAGRDANGGSGAAPDSSQGYAGGATISAGGYNGGGGGGGATGTGVNGSGPDPGCETGGRGGYGAVYPGFGGTLVSPPGTPNPRVPAPIRDSISTGGFYGAGGGGGAGGPGTRAAGYHIPIMNIGGLGGSGGSPVVTSTAGIDLTGSGGGGGPDAGAYLGAAGGKGVCIIRYKKVGSGPAAQQSNGTVHGGTPNQPNIKGSGGVINFTETKIIHYFLQPGTFVANEAISGAKVVLIAGGGGGGGRHGVGGVAGAVGYMPSGSMPAQTNTINVGTGGMGGFGNESRGVSGGDTSIAYSGPTTITAPGGGGGGGYPSSNSGADGGSGGGGGGVNNAGGGTRHPNSTPSGNPISTPLGTFLQYGSNGGPGRSGGPDWRNGAGGGGATAVGSDQPNASLGAGNGGSGLQIPIGDTNYYWAGGGGGGRWNGGPTGVAGGQGGRGGGGGGGSNPGGPDSTPVSGDNWLSSVFPTSAPEPNFTKYNGGVSRGGPGAGSSGVIGTGGGGGGQGQGYPHTPSAPGGRGGSGAPGIVIIEYPA